MAISQTYKVLQDQIADELGDRTDLLVPLSGSPLALSPIQNAIQTAVSKWERESFYFNEVYSVPWFTTVASQEFYTVADEPTLGTTPDVYELHVLVNANRYPLTPRTWAYLDVISANPASNGQPQDWAYFANQVRLYPIPNSAYPIRASRTQRVAELVDDGDTNIWTEDAFDLIRSEAKLILAQEVMQDDELAVRMKRAIYGVPGTPERGYLRALKGETFRRARTRIIPTAF